MPRPTAETITARGKALPDPIVEQIVAKAQGVPLFVEEITRSVLESGALEERDDRYVLRRSVQDVGIPPTLQESLIARLDRLGPAKDVALTAAILGREFSLELIEAVSPTPPGALRAALRQLVEADLLGEITAAPHARYVFKHALIQDAAYQSVLRARRRELHLRIAEALAARFPEVAETEPELLRLKAEALLAAGAGNQDAAERCLDAALSLAREQEARLWELRAAMALAKLRERAGRRKEAYALVAPVRGWFTEGLDTPDLRAASALLEELSR